MRRIEFPRRDPLQIYKAHVFNRDGFAHVCIMKGGKQLRKSLKMPFEPSNKNLILQIAREEIDRMLNREPEFEGFQKLVQIYKREVVEYLKPLNKYTTESLLKHFDGLDTVEDVRAYIHSMNAKNSTKNVVGGLANRIVKHAFKTDRFERDVNIWVRLESDTLAHGRVDIGEVGKVEQPYRDLAYLLCYTGMRFKESKTAKLGKDDHGDDCIKIIGKGGRYREYPYKELNECEPYLHMIGHKIPINTFTRKLNKAGIEGGAHRMRKYHAWHRRVIDKLPLELIAVLEGHNIATMEKHYLGRLSVSEISEKVRFSRDS